ncbi:MAG: HAD-IA family hydrolase [Thermaceae bacterium]|nr:HAD-IA family hydrolase [Thermaceae bacterium]
MKPLSALLFDLDGTLVDTDRLHEQAWLEALASYGIQADHAYYQTHVSGRLNPDIVADVLPQLSRAEAAAFLQGKEERFRQLAQGLLPTKGLARLWDWAQAKGLRLGLVTNAPQANVEHLIAMLGLEFAVRVVAEELRAGKPDPLPYRTALQALGVAPEAALAFEDSPSGVRSAVGAGIRTVALRTGHALEGLEAAGATLVVADFEDPKLWDWLEDLER